MGLYNLRYLESCFLTFGLWNLRSLKNEYFEPFLLFSLLYHVVLDLGYLEPWIFRTSVFGTLGFGTFDLGYLDLGSLEPWIFGTLGL